MFNDRRGHSRPIAATSIGLSAGAAGVSGDWEAPRLAYWIDHRPLLAAMSEQNCSLWTGSERPPRGGFSVCICSIMLQRMSPLLAQSRSHKPLRQTLPAVAAVIGATITRRCYSLRGQYLCARSLSNSSTSQALTSLNFLQRIYRSAKACGGKADLVRTATMSPNDPFLKSSIQFCCPAQGPPLRASMMW
jgi:hypothetical protein